MPPPAANPRVIVGGFVCLLVSAAFYTGYWLPRHSSYAELGRNRTQALRSAGDPASQAAQKGGGSMWAAMKKGPTS